MHSHCINNLINIKDVIVKKVEQNNEFVKFFLETKPTEQVCPCCKQITKRVHDYRMQTIKDLPLQMKHCYLVLRKRRYVCSCGKRFFENYSFLPKYFHHTSRLTYAIAYALRSTESIFDIAKRYNEILNAFKYSHITNGPTEGFNNKIKVLKRSAYGVKNFKRFRTRILLSTH